MEKWRKNKIAYNNKYNQENYKQIKLNFHIKNDAEILKKINTVENKTDYIRKLILEDLKK